MSTSQFIVKRSSLTSRWDPFYFEPELVALEARVRTKTKRTLRDFTLYLAGGATPLKSEGDKHYASAETGVPFLRVQNLTTTGAVDLHDVKYITQLAHTKLLERSRLTGDELLIKITGVGRMAVAAVVPSGLDANINQHIAVVRTKNKQTSEALAAYLNLDFVEKLASRRATGGTRPALDYTALLSIPVIEDERIVELMQLAYLEKNRLEIEAVALLAQMNEVLLKHLGLILPENGGCALSTRIFIRKLSLMEQRLDALFYQTPLLDFLKSSNCLIYALSSVVKTFKSGFAAGKTDQAFDEGVIQIRPTNINDDRQFIFDRNVYLPESLLQEFPQDRLQKGEVLFNNTNSQELVGKTVFFDLEGDFFCSNHITRIGVDTTLLNPRFLCAVLNTYQRMKIFYAMCVNWNNQSGINIEALRKLRIPVPSLTIQDTIVAEIEQLQNQATALRQQALQKLDAAKTQVEHLIFGSD